MGWWREINSSSWAETFIESEDFCEAARTKDWFVRIASVEMYWSFPVSGLILKCINILFRSIYLLMIKGNWQKWSLNFIGCHNLAWKSQSWQSYPQIYISLQLKAFRKRWLKSWLNQHVTCEPHMISPTSESKGYYRHLTLK